MTSLIPFRSSNRWLDQMRNEMDEMFERFLGAPAELKTDGNVTAWAPRLDVAETDKGYEIAAELPGMDEKNVEVKFADGVLTIKGEKQEEKEEKKKDYYLSERNYGSFQRAFQVPDGVDADKIEATFKNGVLTVTMPKSPEAQKSAKKIAVKAA